ncbi:D-aminoacylase [Oscillospiraceae bacterium MB24-C1]|nr:D-aminoacylase [Oscillospiraceae bacterium MB24-C1]
MYDVVIKGGTIVDGTRAAPRVADLCISDGKIAAVCDTADKPGRQVILAQGKIVSPGFIDIHSHSDICPLLPAPFKVQSKLYQGVTTEICGNCGISIVPNQGPHQKENSTYFERILELKSEDFKHDMASVSDYAKRVKKQGCATNFGMLVGHSALRGCTIGFDDRDPTPDEMEQMKALLDSELSQGAFGMSLGLIYPPSAFCKTEELVELAKVVKAHDGILAVHIRNESAKVFESVDEMLNIAALSGVHLHISHLKLMGKPQWGRAKELLDKIANARAQGVNVDCDQYPYHASSTSLTAIVPNWAHDGGFEALNKCLKEKSPRLLSDIAEMMAFRGGPACVLVSYTNGLATEFDGKTVEEISKILGVSPEEAVADVLIRSNGVVKAIYFSMSEQDVFTILNEMDISIGSDGYAFDYAMDGNPHPRSFGTFPRFLRINREQKLMPLEDAVYKMTGLPAKQLGLTDRGILKPGCVADITIFDENKVKDTATFLRSVVKPEGIEHVLVAGVPVLLDGEQTEALPGTALLKAK